MKLKAIFFGMLTSLCLTLGCQTGSVVLRDTPLNISETRKAIVTVTGQPRSTSENGRELISKYYDRKGTMDDAAASARERLYTHIIILGDRRPYDIQVEVVVEVKDRSGIYQQVEKDEGRAEKIALQIQKALVQSRDNRNVIDDFRPF